MQKSNIFTDNLIITELPYTFGTLHNYLNSLHFGTPELDSFDVFPRFTLTFLLLLLIRLNNSVPSRLSLQIFRNLQIALRG